MQHSLEGWDLGKFDEVDWSPWGSGDNARAKVMANADGFYVSIVEAQPGYKSEPHTHTFPEFIYVIEGKVRTQGKELVKGDVYAAAPGSVHSDFESESGATYLSILKI